MKLSILGTLSTVQILLHTWLKGKYAGADQFGNKYYQARARKGYKYNRRWVIYRSNVDSSLVPPEWHGWLHHQTDQLPQEENKHRKAWIKPHQPNLSGTALAYMPESYKGKKRAAATGDYVAWQPPK